MYSPGEAKEYILWMRSWREPRVSAWELSLSWARGREGVGAACLLPTHWFLSESTVNNTKQNKLVGGGAGGRVDPCFICLVFL